MTMTTPMQRTQQPILHFVEDPNVEGNEQISITGEARPLDKSISINTALGYETSLELLYKISDLEESKDKWYNNPLDRTDNKRNTISRDAALDFFKEAIRAYGIYADHDTISNVVWEEDVIYGGDGKWATEFRGNKQIDITEFRNIGIRLENELKIQGHTVNLVDYKDDPKLLSITTNKTSSAIEITGSSDGLLSDYVSLNEALGKSNKTIFNDLVSAENASTKYTKKDKDNKTISIDAVLDFFVEATKAYSVNGISKPQDDIEQIKNALTRADTPKFGFRKRDGQLTFEEFQKAMSIIKSNESAESFYVPKFPFTEEPYTETRTALGNMFDSKFKPI